MYSEGNAPVVHNVLQRHTNRREESEVELDLRGNSDISIAAKANDIVDDSETSDTLHAVLVRNQAAFRFMKWTGNYWPYNDDKHDSTNWIHAFYFCALRSTLVFMFIMMVLFVVIDIIEGPLAPTTVAVTVTMAVISVLPAQYLNQKRLMQAAFQLDAVVVEESVTIATNLMIVCFGTIVASIIILCAGGKEATDWYINVVLLTFVQVLITLYLTFNMLFLMIDLKVSTLLIDQLLLHAECKTLTVQKFNHFRDDIHRRVRNSKWTTDMIMAPCIASVFSILVLFFHGGETKIFMTAAWVTAMSKEFIFVCAAFAYVARVNAQADSLRTKLSRNVWLSSAYMSSTNLADAVKGSELIDEIQRLTMCVSCFAEPISFTLLFKRVSWLNVMVAAASFGVSLILGSVVRSQVKIK